MNYSLVPDRNLRVVKGLETSVTCALPVKGSSYTYVTQTWEKRG